MSLIVSGFSYITDVRISGERVPLVSTKVHPISVGLIYLSSAYWKTRTKNGTGRRNAMVGQNNWEML